MLYDISQTAIGDLVEAVELFNKVNDTSYDGIILDTETVVFNPNQIKSVENGGTFGSWDNDIMKSKPDTGTDDTNETYIPTTSSFEIDKADKAKLDIFLTSFWVSESAIECYRVTRHK